MGTGFCVRARHNGESFVPCDDYNITLLSTTQSGKKIAGMEITTDPTGFGQPKVLKGFKSHTYAYRYENRSIQEYSSTLPFNVIHLNSGHRGKKSRNKTKQKNGNLSTLASCGGFLVCLNETVQTEYVYHKRQVSLAIARCQGVADEKPHGAIYL